MARYINADALIQILEARAEMAFGTPKQVFHSVANMVDKLHAADVVPRAAAAREIFEEINVIKKEFASGDIDGNELYRRLYMLEKKYTEEKNHE